MRTKIPKVVPHWEARYCDGETERPRMYRWEVTETGEAAYRDISGYVRVSPNAFRLAGEDPALGMTRRQAIAIASALNALDSLEE